MSQSGFTKVKIHQGFFQIQRSGFLRLFALTALAIFTIEFSRLLPIMPAQSQTPQQFAWKNVNIQGMGYVTGIAVSPVSPNDVYVRTDVGGPYRFDRGGNKWLPLMDMYNTNFARGGIGVESVAVDPVLSSRVYVAVNRGNSTYQEWGKQKYNYSGEVMVSDDRGVTWKPTGLGSKNVFVGPNSAYRADTGERLMVDPNKSGLLYFASRKDGLWKRNGDAGWERVNGGLPGASSLPGYSPDNVDMPGFTFVAFDKNSGGGGNASRNIYVGVHGSGVWASNDGGNSWRNIGGANNPVRGTVASDGTLYVSFATWDNNWSKNTGSVRRFKNGSWTNITPDGDRRIYSAVTVQPNVPNVVMAVADREVYRSTNSGVNWTKLTMTMGANDPNEPGVPTNSTAPGYYKGYSSSGAAAIAFDPSNTKQLWWVNGWGVARTDDVTAAKPFYKWLMNNLEELDSNMVRVPPKPKSQGGADLLSAVQDMIGFRHVDRNLVPTSKINPQGIPINPDFKWANPNWTTYPIPFPHVAGATGMDYSYKNPDNAALVGFHQWQGFWPVHGITSDNGQTWKAFPSIPIQTLWKYDKSGQEQARAIAGQIAMSPTNPQNMVWAPSWGTYPHYTMDGGKTWKLANNLDAGSKPNPFDAKNNDHIFYQALPKSWANGISPWLSAYILTSDRADPQGKTFYYFDNQTFFYSNDGGANWKKGASGQFPGFMIRPTVVSNPLKQRDVWMSIARNPEDINGNKLYRSMDGGKSFTTVGSVDSCEFITFGKGANNINPYIYIFGRVRGATQDTMYKSEDMGNSWIQISDPSKLQFPGLTHMEGDMRTSNLVYTALAGRGIMVGSK